MKGKKPMTNKEKIAELAASLSSNEHYFVIHTNSYVVDKTNYNEDQDLLPLVYGNDESTTLLQLISTFIQNLTEDYPFWKAIKEKTKQKDNEKFEEYLLRVAQINLLKGHLVSLEITIRQLKKILRTDYIDGLHLFINPVIYQENATLKYIQNEASFFQGDVEIPFIEQQSEYVLYLHVQSKQTLSSLKKKLAQEIQLVFGKNVNLQNIVITIQQKGKKIELSEKDEKNLCSLSKKDKLQFVVKDTLLKPPKSQNSNVLVVKGEGFEPVNYDFGSIFHLKVEQLLEKIDPKKSWADFGMIIDQFTLKSIDKLDKVKQLFKKSQIHSKHIVGLVVKEMHVFELQLKKIKEKGSFVLKSIVYEDKNNLQHERTCQKEIEQRAKKTSIASFKGKLNSIKPILLYTSELEVRGSSQENPQRMYRILNQFLRTQNFCRVQEIEYSKWEYQFGCDLISQLRKIECLSNHKTPLWRGVSYRPNHKKGDIIEFKQFTSSSMSEQTASEFANEAIFKIVKSYSGKCIKEFSFYQYEDEILFEPYTYFKVKDIEKYQNDAKKTIPCYVLEELQKEEIPRNVEVFVLWVDDKTNEGKQIWASLTGVKRTILMVQLLSTEQLRQWLERNQKVLEEPETEVVMITNMTRKENGVEQKEAGAQGIKVFKKYKPDAPIMVYIGWVEGTIEKLKKHQLYPDKTIQVTCYEEELQTFLKKNCMHP